MYLAINKLSKDKRNKNTQSNKYYLSTCQTKVDNSIDKNTKDFLVINRIIKNPEAFNNYFRNGSGVFNGLFENKNIILKIIDNDKAEKEYIISKYLYEAGYDGFVRFLCKFSCTDNIDKYSKIDKDTAVCDSNGNVRITSLLMDEYKLGSIKNYKWTKDNVGILKDILKETLEIFLKVSKETGFIHKDFHADNIMIDDNYNPIIIDLELSVFINNTEINKDYIYRALDKDQPIEKLVAKYDLKKLFSSLLELPNSQIRLDTTDILKKIRKIEENDNENIYDVINLIDLMEYY